MVRKERSRLIGGLNAISVTNLLQRLHDTVRHRFNAVWTTCPDQVLEGIALRVFGRGLHVPAPPLQRLHDMPVVTVGSGDRPRFGGMLADRFDRRRPPAGGGFKSDRGLC